jgi:hypothetical protein
MLQQDLAPSTIGVVYAFLPASSVPRYGIGSASRRRASASGFQGRSPSGSSPPATEKVEALIDALAAHLAAFLAARSRCWMRPASRTRSGGPGSPASGPGGGRRQDWRRGDFHDLRHYYASLLIRHGESVKVVQQRLGHKSAVETLDTNSHLWPDSEDRTREAVDEVLGRVTGGVNARMAS